MFLFLSIEQLLSSLATEPIQSLKHPLVVFTQKQSSFAAGPI